MFSAPAYAAVHRQSKRPAARRRTGPVQWVDDVAEHLPDGPLRSLVSELAVEPPEWLTADSAEYAGGSSPAGARIANGRSRLQSAMQRAEAAGDRERR